MTLNYTQVKAIKPILKFKCHSDTIAVKLETEKDRKYDLKSIPDHVEHIHFGDNFNQRINKDVLPEGLKSIRFGSAFNRRIGKNVLPKGLQSIQFGWNFNQPIEKDVLPEGLQSIRFGYNFKQQIEKDLLPKGLQSIGFDRNAYKKPPPTTKSLVFSVIVGFIISIIIIINQIWKN